MQDFLKRFIEPAGPTLVALFWGSAFVSIKLGLRDFSAQSLITLRFALAAIGFLALYAAQAIAFRRIESRDLPRFAFLVLTGVLTYHLSLVWAETVLPASVASLIGQTTAIFTLAFSVVVGAASLRPRMVIGVGLASAGTFLIISGGQFVTGGPVPLVPVLVCFGAPLSLAAYTLLGKPMVSRYGAANLSAQVCIAGGAILAGSTLFRPSMIGEMAAASRTSWTAVTCLALFSTVAAYTLWYNALSRRTASQLAMYTYLVPIFGVLLSAVALREHIGMSIILGGAAVIGGISLTNSGPTGPWLGRKIRPRQSATGLLVQLNDRVAQHETTLAVAANQMLPSRTDQ